MESVDREDEVERPIGEGQGFSGPLDDAVPPDRNVCVVEHLGGWVHAKRSSARSRERGEPMARAAPYLQQVDGAG